MDRLLNWGLAGGKNYYRAAYIYLTLILVNVRLWPRPCKNVGIVLAVI